MMVKTSFVGLAVLLILLAGCTPQPETIKVGVLGPLTGPVARFGDYMREGIELAVGEINLAGGIDGKKIELIYEDDKCNDLKSASEALQKFKNVDKVAAVLGPYCGGPNFVAGKFSTDNDLFVISPGDNFGFTGKFKVNTRYLITKEAELLADYALKQGWKNLGILYFENEWGQAYRDGIKAYLEAHGGNLLIHEVYTIDFDARTQLLKIKDANPDAVVIVDALGGEMFKQAKEIGLSTPLLSEWEIENPAQGANASLFEDVVYALPEFDTTDFHRRFSEKYNKDANMVHVDSFDAAMILSKALSACEQYDAQCMIDFVTNLKDYPGAGGPMTFDKDRWNFEKHFVYKTVKNGKYVKI